MFPTSLTVVDVAAVVVLTAAGAATHELGHYVLGVAFGAAPTFSKYQLGLPARTSFDDAAQLSNLQVRVLTGYVVVFPVLLIPALWFRHVAAAAFLIGAGLSVSATDLVGLFHPAAWRRLATGGAVSAEDLEDPGVLK